MWLVFAVLGCSWVFSVIVGCSWLLIAFIAFSQEYFALGSSWQFFAVPGYCLLFWGF